MKVINDHQGICLGIYWTQPHARENLSELSFRWVRDDQQPFSL